MIYQDQVEEFCQNCVQHLQDLGILLRLVGSLGVVGQQVLELGVLQNNQAGGVSILRFGTAAEVLVGALIKATARGGRWRLSDLLHPEVDGGVEREGDDVEDQAAELPTDIRTERGD